MEGMTKFLEENLKNADLDTVTKADLKKAYMKEIGVSSLTKEDKKLFSNALNRVMEKYASYQKVDDSSDSESELKEIFEKENSSNAKSMPSRKVKNKRKLSISSEDEDFQKMGKKKKKQAKILPDNESDAAGVCKESTGLSNSSNAKKKKGNKRKLSSEAIEREKKKAHMITSDSEEETSEVKLEKKFSIDSEDDSLGALALSDSEGDDNPNLSKSFGSSKKKLSKKRINGNYEKPSNQVESKKVLSKSLDDSNSSGDELLTNIKKEGSSDSEDEPLINSRKNSNNSEDELSRNKSKPDSSDSEDEPLSKVTSKDVSNLKKDSSTNLPKDDSSDSEDEPLVKSKKEITSDSEEEPLKKSKKKNTSDSEDDLLSNFKNSDSEDESTAKVARENTTSGSRKSVISSDSEDDSIVKKSNRRSSVHTPKTKAHSLKKKKGGQKRKSRNSSGQSDGESSDEAETVSEESKSKGKPESTKKLFPSVKRLENVKKYVRAAGIRVPSYDKFFEDCKTFKSKQQKLLDLLEKHGMEGRPTLAKCKKLKVKIEALREVAELDRSKIIKTKGRPRRNACVDVSNINDTPVKVASPVKLFSGLKDIVDSD